MKDNFSKDADQYAQFRPGYPEALVSRLLPYCNGYNQAWDCATGNGQLAVMLAPHFASVQATDISKQQLDQAKQVSNITYRQEAAEQTTFADKSFDLITVAQAIHWFQFDAFYKEVYRTLKDDGLFVAVGYGLLQINCAIDNVVLHLYKKIISAYWDAERKYVDEAYQTIPFPFQEIEAPSLSIQYQWDFRQLTGYLYTWSAVKHFREKEQSDPILMMEQELKQAWGNEETHTVTFPTLLRMGRKMEPSFANTLLS